LESPVIKEKAPQPQKDNLYVHRVRSLDHDLEALLTKACLVDRIGEARRILLKPNLVNDSPPPVTTPVEVVRGVLCFLKKRLLDREFLIAEGCGAPEYETGRPFRKLGYERMAAEEGVRLVDLNTESQVVRRRADCPRLPEMSLPEVALSCFLISLPVLKAHSFSQVTLSLKNMMGLASPRLYSAGSWNKSAFHHRLEEAIVDLNRYRSPDFTLLDARSGLKDFHLGGSLLNPAPGLLVAGFDPVAVDAYGASLLKRDPRRIGHIAQSDGILGWIEPESVVQDGRI
jgi:uncharacterized protein (DUF362 family)